MMLRIALLLSCLLVPVGTAAPAATPAAAKPNILYLLADDLGWSDLSIHPGGKIRTPVIDSLFKEGVELRNFMGWCVCSPTRAMLLTGRHPFRVGTGPEVGGELDAGETTIAEVFKGAGYRTGVFGKWHNGEDPATPEFTKAFREAFASQPNKPLPDGLGANAHGFDEAWVYYGGGADYFTRKIAAGRGPVSWWHNREYRPQDAGYTEDMITRRAVEFLRAHRENPQPFFCYVPFHIVHAPLQAQQADLAKVDPAITDPDQRTYAAMVEALDRNVAMLLSELDALGLRDNTIVVFTSDNGATKQGSNLPLRGGKHSLFEGGTRLATTVRWPAGGLTGGRTWDGLCGALDMLPTLSAMAGIPLPATRPLDGKNLWPAIRDNQPSPVASYYWSWHEEDCLRTADWRLHRFFDSSTLYNIRDDPGESNDLAASKPEVVAKLTAEMDAWANSLGVALSHKAPPARLDAKPAPAGDILTLTVTVSDKARPKDTLVVPIASPDIPQVATDFIEFDVRVAATTPARASWFFSPFKGNNGNYSILFKRGQGIDQFGRDQSSCPPVRTGPNTWEHRVIGMSTTAPGTLPRCGIIIRGGQPGTYTIHLDNLRLRHLDGSTTPIWSDASHSKPQKIPTSENFPAASLTVGKAEN